MGMVKTGWGIALAAALGGGAWSFGASAALVDACRACHGSAGISDSQGIPNLAGQKREYLASQLKAFRGGERKNELMAAVAGQLSDAQITELAQFWSGQPPIAPAATASAPGGVVAIRSRMPFPAGFPNGFELYETVVSTEDKSVAKRYANTVALKAARAGTPLPDGSVIVVVAHAAVLDAQGRSVAGEVQSYAAMESRAGWGDAVPELLRNGNWDYALFGADRTRRDSLNQAQCLACHKPIAASSYVFTLKTLAQSR